MENPGCGPRPWVTEHTGSSQTSRCPRPVHAPHPGLRVGLGLCSNRPEHSSPCFQTLRCPPACWSFRSKLRHGWMSEEKLIIQFSSVAQLCLTLCNPMNRSTPGLPVHHQPPEFIKLTSIKSVMPSSHLILCRPLFLLPPVPPTIRVFSNESTLHMRWPKYWSFNFSISPSKEIPGLISFRMDWLDLPAVQGTLKSLLQHHSSKASIFQHSAFFTVQLSIDH